MKMLTRTFLFTAFMVLFISQAVAQAGNTKVITGVVNFNSQDYESALKALNEGLSDPSQVSAKNLPKGYYYRAKTRMMLMQQAVQSGDQEKVAGMENVMMDVYADYKKALETDDGKWAKNVNNDLTVLRQSVLQGSLMALNMAYGKDLTPEEKKDALAQVVKYTDMAIDMDKTDYVPVDLRGQAHLQQGDSTAALADFVLAADLYNKHMPKVPDMLIAYVYYRISVINRYKVKDMDKAYSALTDGKNTLESEYKRLDGVQGLTEDFKAKKTEQYQNAKEDLRNLEMDLLLNFPEKRAQAVAEFKKAVVDNPNDYIIHVAYANLLELDNREEAIKVYLKAISIKPKEEIAIFNLGALYNNIGKEFFDQANATNDAVKAKELQDEGNKYLEKGLEQFENAVAINPQSLAAVRAAKQISITLNNMEKYQKYKDMEGKLTGK